ncbi:entericidin A/B family lipoprotein [Lautropia mirabilis]|jgi:entericidin ecnAB
MMIKKLTAALLGVAFVLAGCNTMSGMGQDIQDGGKKLERKAEDVKSGS